MVTVLGSCSVKYDFIPRLLMKSSTSAALGCDVGPGPGPPRTRTGHRETRARQFPFMLKIIIKNFMRITMGQERSNDLDILSLERDTTRKLDFISICCNFCRKNAPKAITFNYLIKLFYPDEDLYCSRNIGFSY